MASISQDTFSWTTFIGDKTPLASSVIPFEEAQLENFNNLVLNLFNFPPGRRSSSPASLQPNSTSIKFPGTQAVHTRPVGLCTPSNWLAEYNPF